PTMGDAAAVSCLLFRRGSRRSSPMRGNPVLLEAERGWRSGAVYTLPMPSHPDRHHPPRPLTPIRDLLEEETVEFPAHERAPGPGAPATPAHGPALRAAYALVAVLVGTTAGLGSALVSVNTDHLQQVLDLSVH